MKIDAPLFESLVVQYQQRVDAALDRWLPPADVNPMRLHQAMRYAVLAPGTRVRPILVYATAAALDSLEEADVRGIFAAAITAARDRAVELADDASRN